MLNMVKRWGLCALLLVTASVHAEQTAEVMEKDVETRMQYLVYLPDDYASTEGDYPLVLYLHGGDESGDDIDKLRTGGLPLLVEQGHEFPFIILSPQNPYTELFFPIERVKTLLDDVVERYRVDESRISVVGYSRGAYGAWMMSEQYPETFAGVVPIAGGGIARYLGRTGEDVAFWVFHGAGDDVISLSESVDMVEGLKALGRDVTLTVYSDADHSDVWQRALAEPELTDWLMQRSTAEATEAQTQ
ncbi:dienelactone hydrolase family protein [Halomonas cupida]|uniref:carboxylesterase family protein n=1 Tax=Halomonas cupida TaxID=44933 RepID=UPI0039B46D45